MLCTVGRLCAGLSDTSVRLMAGSPARKYRLSTMMITPPEIAEASPMPAFTTPPPIAARFAGLVKNASTDLRIVPTWSPKVSCAQA